MPLKWKFFRIVCILQLLITAFLASISLINLFQFWSFYYFFSAFAFSLVLSLAVLGINILNNNYPDTPITGTQKKGFNWLYLLNFLLLAYLFGLIFSELGALKNLKDLVRKSFFQLPIKFYFAVIINSIVLIFQLIILYGLYVLRRFLYQNIYNNKFEFETHKEI